MGSGSLEGSPIGTMAPVKSESEKDRAQAGDTRDRMIQAAIEAELDTGEREESRAKAKAGVRRRIARMTAGFALLFLGGLLLVLPGPGWLCIAAGLAILSRDVAWAERALGGVRKRLPQGSDGNVPKYVIVVSISLMLAGAGASIWLWLR
jgi:hypothetical protein